MSAVDCFVWLGPSGVEAGASQGGRWLEVAAWQATLSAPVGETGPSPVMAALTALAAHWNGEATLPAAGRRLWVGVSDGHLASATLPWSDLLLQAGLMPSVARAQLVQSGHEATTGDVVRLAATPAGTARLVLGFGPELMAAWHELARGVNAQLMSVLPSSAMAWQQAAALKLVRGGRVGVLFDDQALLLQGGRDIERASGHFRDGAPQALAALWARAKLRAWSAPDEGTARDEPAVLPVLDLRRASASIGAGTATSGALEFSVWPAGRPVLLASPVLRLLREASQRAPHALDAMDRPAVLRGWQKAAVAVLVMVTAALLMDNVSVWQDRREATARLPVESAPHTAQAGVPALSRDELARVQQVNEAITRLNLPVEALLSALQPPKDIPVALSSVELRAAAPDGRSATVVKAQAPLAADMTRYAAHVGATAPFTEAHLRQHEQRVNEPGQPYLFTLEAAWRQ